MTVRNALRIVLMREHLRKTVMIALVVGTIIATINHADVIFRGAATGGTWTKIGVTYLVPFIVSNLGLLAGKRAEMAAGALDRGPTSG